MIIWDCDDGFVAEIQSDDDFDAFLKAFTANDDVKHHYDDFEEAFDYDDGDDDFDVIDDFDDFDCDDDFGYDPYMGEYTYDC